MSVRILEGDALTVLRTLPDCSVQMCVTSPPYFGLRDYGVVGQLGLEKTPQLYVDAMVGVFSEVKRVLRDDGTLWLNIGDSYAGSGKGGNPEGSPWKGFVGNSQREAAATAHAGKERLYGCKQKDLLGVPWLLALALRADGWYLRSDIIWHKPNPMPESVTDRPTKSHEYLFLLTKSATYFYDADAIAERLTDSIIERLSQPSIDDQEGSDRVPGKTNGRMKAVAGPSWRERREAGATAGNIGASDTYQRGVHGEGLSHDLGQIGVRNKRSVWTITTQPFRSAHFATFPPKLIEPCILAGSAKGDTVLDPFMGAGTTGLVADRLGRNAIGIELNPKYAEMARKRITDDSPLFGDVA